MPAAPPTTLARAITREVPPAAAGLLAALPGPTGSVAFVIEGTGLVGWGVHASTAASGPEAAGAIGDWWQTQRAALAVDDPIGARGTGPVVFVSLGFAPTDTAVAVIPRVVLGRVDGRSFVTEISAAEDGAEATTIGPAAQGPDAADPAGDGSAVMSRPIAAPGQITYADADLSVAGYTAAVAEAVHRIRAGLADKVVLAHDLVATAEYPVDERYLLTRLAAAYPTCATYAVDGFVGASPELLVRRTGRHVLSRVLAGTAWPEPGHADAAVELASAKNLSEHAFAVASAADVLRELTDRLDVPERPGLLALATLTHLATDLSGELDDRALTALQIAARLHPTAAVGGTPRDVALAMIAELEPTPRDRYAAPVGWMDGRGDGEFAIALRCAALDGRTVRLMAGGGIVVGSDPDTEAREAQVKMRPVRDALEGR